MANGKWRKRSWKVKWPRRHLPCEVRQRVSELGNESTLFKCCYKVHQGLGGWAQPVRFTKMVCQVADGIQHCQVVLPGVWGEKKSANRKELKYLLPAGREVFYRGRLSKIFKKFAAEEQRSHSLPLWFGGVGSGPSEEAATQSAQESKAAFEIPILNLTTHTCPVCA